MRSARNRKKKWSFEHVLGLLILCLFSLLCIVPIWSVISIALSDEAMISQYGYSLIPRGITLDAFRYVMDSAGWQLAKAYGVTITTTAAGTVLSLVFMSMMAYALARPDFRWARIFGFLVYFTLLFNGGMVPGYMVVTRVLHLKDTLGALIFPYVIGAWNLLLMRTFFKGIPYELIEAAKIDGAGNFSIYLKVTVPLCKAAFATIGVLVALQYWNDWWLPLLYIDSNKLANLQYLLYRIMANIQAISEMAASGAVDVDFSNIPSETVRMAMCILAAGPMLVKFFAKGIMAGSIKG